MNIIIRKDNTSGFKGVTLHKSTGHWEAKLGLNGKVKYLGVFETPVAAAVAYDSAAVNFHGEFATTNKMLGLLGCLPDSQQLTRVVRCSQ